MQTKTKSKIDKSMMGGMKGNNEEEEGEGEEGIERSRVGAVAEGTGKEISRGEVDRQ